MDTFNHKLSIFAKHSVFQYQIIIPLRGSFSSGRPIEIHGKGKIIFLDNHCTKFDEDCCI